MFERHFCFQFCRICPITDRRVQSGNRREIGSFSTPNAYSKIYSESSPHFARWTCSVKPISRWDFCEVICLELLAIFWSFVEYKEFLWILNCSNLVDTSVNFCDLVVICCAKRHKSFLIEIFLLKFGNLLPRFVWVLWLCPLIFSESLLIILIYFESSLLTFVIIFEFCDFVHLSTRSTLNPSWLQPNTKIQQNGRRREPLRRSWIQDLQ